MSLEGRMRRAYENMKAPEGKYVVYVWDSSNPEKSIPTQVAGPFSVENFALAYIRRMDTKPQPKIGERAYLLVDDQGRVWW